MVAFNAKVIYRFAVISAEKILCISWFLVHFEIRLFCLFTKAKLARKRSFNNLSNEYKFLYVPNEFVVKKRFVMSGRVLIFFPRKKTLKC